MSQPNRSAWVKVRAREAERAEWHRKARSAGLSLSALVRRTIGRIRTWTAPRADLERARLVQLARIGNNLNQIPRWANTHKGGAEAVQVVAHLVALRREIRAFAGIQEPSVVRATQDDRGAGVLSDQERRIPRIRTARQGEDGRRVLTGVRRA